MGQDHETFHEEAASGMRLVVFVFFSAALTISVLLWFFFGPLAAILPMAALSAFCAWIRFTSGATAAQN